MKTDWLKKAGWGVFFHYVFHASVQTTAEEWNKLVDGFDVEKLTGQLREIGAKYCFITIGQNSGHYCAPNSVYDSIIGIKPSKCSQRDLISDLSDALKPEGIRLLVYSSNSAPADAPVEMEKLGWKWGFKAPPHEGWGNYERTGERLAEFQLKWEAVIKEWSIRWGRKIHGWWIDGCYFADEMYRYPDPPNFESFVAALKSGNPDSIIAFNPGVTAPVISLTEIEDYTAGEISEVFPVCPGRWVNKAQYHILSYLGKTWGEGAPRFTEEFVFGYTRETIEREGVVTWDVPIEKDGSIPKPFLNQLKTLKELSGR